MMRRLYSQVFLVYSGTPRKYARSPRFPSTGRGPCAWLARPGDPTPDWRPYLRDILNAADRPENQTPPARRTLRPTAPESWLSERPGAGGRSADSEFLRPHGIPRHSRDATPPPPSIGPAPYRR